MAAPRRIALVMNADAAADEALAEAVLRLRGEGLEVEALAVSDDADGAQLAAEAVKRRAQTVVAAGGDGTLHEVANGLALCAAPSGTTVGLVPYGTGNDFAGAVGIEAGRPEAALRLVLEAPAVPVDLGCCEGRAFVNAATGGFPAELTTEVGPGAKAVLGRFAYAITGLAKAARLTAAPARVRAPGLDWSGSLYAVAVSNGRRAGGGVSLNPRAVVDDGLLDLVLLPEEPDASILDMLLDHRRLVRQEVAELFMHHPVREVVIEAPGGLQMNLDGEPMRAERFEIRVHPGRLRMHLPVATPVLTRNVPAEGERG